MEGYKHLPNLKIKRPLKRKRWTTRRAEKLANRIISYCQKASELKAEVVGVGTAAVVIPPKFPTIQECILYTHHNSNDLADLSKRFPDSIGFAIKRLKEIQEMMLIQHGMNKNYAAAFAIFTAKNIMDWKDSPIVAVDNSQHKHFTRVVVIREEKLPEVISDRIHDGSVTDQNN